MCHLGRRRCRDNENDALRRVKTELLVQFDGVASGADDRILILGSPIACRHARTSPLIAGLSQAPPTCRGRWMMQHGDGWRVTDKPSPIGPSHDLHHHRPRQVKRIYIPLPDDPARAQLIQHLLRDQVCVSCCIVKVKFANSSKQSCTRLPGAAGGAAPAVATHDVVKDYCELLALNAGARPGRRRRAQTGKCCKSQMTSKPTRAARPTDRPTSFAQPSPTATTRSRPSTTATGLSPRISLKACTFVSCCACVARAAEAEPQHPLQILDLGCGAGRDCYVLAQLGEAKLLCSPRTNPLT